MVQECRRLSRDGPMIGVIFARAWRLAGSAVFRAASRASKQFIHARKFFFSHFLRSSNVRAIRASTRLNFSPFPDAVNLTQINEKPCLCVIILNNARDPQYFSISCRSEASLFGSKTVHLENQAAHGLSVEESRDQFASWEEARGRQIRPPKTYCNASKH